MESVYRSRYGVAGNVLYPSRSKHATPAQKPHPKVLGSIPNPTIAFAGTLVTPGYAELLRKTAVILSRCNGRLLLYGPISPIYVEQHGLDLPNVEFRGMIPTTQLPAELQRNADILILPMSFEESERSNMTVCFPSKLTDYTSVGLPVLIVGPEYSSAVRWAQENPGAAATVTLSTERALSDTIASLLRSPELRYEYAAKALETGAKYFAPEIAKQTFMSSITQTRTPLSQ